MEKKNPKTDLDERLDNALMATFPCSDPFSFEASTAGARQPGTENTADESRRPVESRQTQTNDQ